MIEVCPDCKAEWLHEGELQKIVEHHDEVFTPEEIASLEAVNKEIFTAEKEKHDELSCPHCENAQMEFSSGFTAGMKTHSRPTTWYRSGTGRPTPDAGCPPKPCSARPNGSSRRRGRSRTGAAFPRCPQSRLCRSS